MEILCRKPSGERPPDTRWPRPGIGAGHFISTTTPDTPNSGKMPSLSEFIFGGEDRKPKGRLPTVDPREAWAAAPETGLRATWLGHSTLLLEIDGCRILTDPVWGARVSPLPGIGPKRFQPAPVRIGALPKLDAVLISHDHYDHLDYPSIRALAKLPVNFITSLGVGLHLEAWGVAPERITELSWWEKTTVAGETRDRRGPDTPLLGRALHDRSATLWSSFALRGTKHAVFFSGDTRLSSAFSDIGARLGPFDLTIDRGRRLPPCLGHRPPRPRECTQSLEATRQRQAAAHPLGHVQPGHSPLVRTRRSALRQGLPKAWSCRGWGTHRTARTWTSVEPWWRNTVQIPARRSCMWEAAESLLLPIKD